MNEWLSLDGKQGKTNVVLEAEVFATALQRLLVVRREQEARGVERAGGPEFEGTRGGVLGDPASPGTWRDPGNTRWKD